jgi:hypothetical protein
MISNQDAANLLIQTAVKGKESYHAGYDWTIQYAKDCKAYFGGIGIDEYLRRFDLRESDAQFAQRKVVTAHINKCLGSALSASFEKVARSNYNRVLAFDRDAEGKKAKQFDRDVLKNWHEGGLDQYAFSSLLHFQKYDPNAFVVVEFDSTDGVRRARPYPFEVSSDMAVRYNYNQHGTIEWLIVRQVQNKASTNNTTQKVERLTIYRPNQTIVFQQLTDEEKKAVPVIPAKAKGVEQDPQNGQVFQAENGNVYVFEVPIPHRYDKTPAIRAGHIKNPEDKGQTRLSIFDAAMPWSKKILKINSELDITQAYAAFPVAIRHEERCDAVGCMSGKLPDGSLCGTCAGTGKKPRPMSAGDEIVLALPDRPEDMFDVTKILHYTSAPTEVVQMQMQTISTYLQNAKESVFNSQMFSKQETAKTATFQNIELQSVYDTLYPYAQNIASFWGFVAYACKTFTGFDVEMTAALVFPSDFRFETVNDLFAELKSARESGAGPVVYDMICRRIVDRMLVDDPERLGEVMAEMRLDPFAGMTEEQVIVALASQYVPNWKKVYYLNRNSILAEVESEDPAFFLRPYQEQIDRIKAKATEYAALIESEVSAMVIPEFGPAQPAQSDSVGKIPLALQQLALARQRAFETNDNVLAGQIGSKISELLDQI